MASFMVNKEKMNEAAATAHTFKEATSVAASNLPESVRRTFKERIPSEAGVRYAPFEVLKQGMSVILPGAPVTGSSPTTLAEAWSNHSWVEGVVIMKKDDGATRRVYRGVPELPWEFGVEVWLPAVPDGGFGVARDPSMMFGTPGKRPSVSCVARESTVGGPGKEEIDKKTRDMEENQIKSVYYVIDDYDGRTWRIDSKAKARERVEKLQGLLRLWKSDMIATHLPDMVLDPAQLRARITYVAAVSGAAGCSLTEEMSWFPGAHLILHAYPFTNLELFEKVLLGKWFFGLDAEQRVRLSDFSNERVTWATHVNAADQFLIIANCCEMVQRFISVLWATEFSRVMDPVIAFLRDASGQLRLVPPVYMVSRIETALHRFSTAVFRDRVSAEWSEQRKTVKGCVSVLVHALGEAIDTRRYEPFPQPMFFASKGEFEVLFRQHTGSARVERAVRTPHQQQPKNTEPRRDSGVTAPRASGDKRSSDQQVSGGAKKTRKESVPLPCLRFLGGFCKVVDKNTGPVKCERDPCRFLHSVDMLKGTSSSQAIEAIDAVATRFSWRSDLVTALKQRPQLFKQ
jgi:hypothetical protein